MSERDERYIYNEGDVTTITSQCKDCKFNENKPLSCKKYTRIPNGTRSCKVKCPFKEELCESK